MEECGMPKVVKTPVTGVTAVGRIDESAVSSSRLHFGQRQAWTKRMSRAPKLKNFSTVAHRFTGGSLGIGEYQTD